MSDETMRVTPGQPFEIDLEENPTTGFVWRLEPAVPGIVVDEDTYERGAGAGIGGGGKRVFRLQAEHAGQYRVEFQLRRAWEKTPAQSRVINIDAQ